MTDRLKGILVTLDVDVREDDAEPILNAIRQIRHVADVRPVLADIQDHIVGMRVRMDLEKKLFEVLRPELSEGKTR